MDDGEPRVPAQRNPSQSGDVPDMSGEEAVACYLAWRQRIFGDRQTKGNTIEEVYEQVREVYSPPSR